LAAKQSPFGIHLNAYTCRPARYVDEMVSGSPSPFRQSASLTITTLLMHSNMKARGKAPLSAPCEEFRIPRGALHRREKPIEHHFHNQASAYYGDPAGN
jgi:hypothetical protein